MNTKSTYLVIDKIFAPHCIAYPLYRQTLIAESTVSVNRLVFDTNDVRIQPDCNL